MIDRGHGLPLARQAQQLGISRGSIYYLPRAVSDTDLAIMRRIDELHLLYPFAGSRMLRDLLRQEGMAIEALEEALARYGKPAIFNSDQGSQFTSTAFTAVLLREKIAISMDGRCK